MITTKKSMAQQFYEPVDCYGQQEIASAQVAFHNLQICLKFLFLLGLVSGKDNFYLRLGNINSLRPSDAYMRR